MHPARDYQEIEERAQSGEELNEVTLPVSLSFKNSASVNENMRSENKDPEKVGRAFQCYYYLHNFI